MNIDSAINLAISEAGVIQTVGTAAADNDEQRAAQERNSTIKKVAVVQCEGFRCLAYRDAELWRDFQTGKELPEVKNIVFEFAV